jgi:hypothetical protein
LAKGCLNIESGNEAGGSNSGVMRGLDPRIHDETPQENALRKYSIAANHHGLPGQARQ